MTAEVLRRVRRKKVVAVACWAAGFGLWWVFLGLPLTDPLLAFGWLWLLTVAWRIDRPRREHLRFGRDWAPVAVLLVLYNLSRGFADNGTTPHAFELIEADRAMFGGTVPTVWLQQHLYDPAGVHWWDVLVSWVYFSHFVVSLAIAVVLWLRDRSQWARFMRRWFALSLAGLVTYFAYPAAPPWWAGRFGLLPEVARISTRGWRAIGLHGAGNVLNAGQVAANPVAAMPSLHSAFALLAVVFFFGRVRRRWWPVLLLYPLAMTFSLVYSGEHYVVDVLVGWSYVGLVLVAVSLAERWWSARRSGSAGGAETGGAEADGSTGVEADGGPTRSAQRAARDASANSTARA
jgi:membrane-associated phospholipid phosphatase